VTDLLDHFAAPDLMEHFGAYYYHGTNRDLKPGDMIEPGHEQVWEGSSPHHVYMTPDHDLAHMYAETAAAMKEHGSPRVYTVEPTGPHEDDPEFGRDDDATEGLESYRSAHPLRVIEGAADAGFPNPYHGTAQFGGRPEWSRTWFHGTRGVPEFGERRGHGDDVARTRLPFGERMKGSGWPQPNQMMGVHFSPLHEVAHKFAGSVSSTPSAIVHARLHMSNPAHYPSEMHLNYAVAHWASQHYPHWHDQKVNDHLGWNYSDREGTHRDFSSVPDRKYAHDKAQDVLQWHPHLPEILHGFRQHLREQGHRGITYGNNVEGPYETDATRGGEAGMKAIRKREGMGGSPVSISAIVHPGDIEITHAEHISPWRKEPEPHERTWEAVSDADEPDEMRDRVLAWHREHGGAYPRQERTAARMAASGSQLEGRDYEGTEGNPSHITRTELGMIRTDAIAGLHGVKGERPGEHRNRQGAKWDEFKQDIASNGIRHPVFITVDHGEEPKISEGNHRRDAAVELGHSHVPAEITYFGHAERAGTVESRGLSRHSRQRIDEHLRTHNWCAQCSRDVRKDEWARHVNDHHRTAARSPVMYHASPYHNRAGIARLHPHTAAAGRVWYHGTPDERTWEHGAGYGIHIGTEDAARQALHARIGKPAEGEWDGTREYGKTLLNRDQRRWEWKDGKMTDHVDHHPPSYPDPEGGPSYSGGERIPMDARPSVFPVHIKGPMTNTPDNPHPDFHANGYMHGQIKRGRAKSGYFYTNVSEDEGSISAVVPSAAHLERIHPPHEAARRTTAVSHWQHRDCGVYAYALTQKDPALRIGELSEEEHKMLPAAHRHIRENKVLGDRGQKTAKSEKPTRSKASVNYRHATGKHRCGNCVMFRLHSPDFESGGCTLVKGAIKASDTCDKWYPQDKASKSGGLLAHFGAAEDDEPNRAVHALVEHRVSQQHPEVNEPVTDHTATLRAMLGRASFFMPREEIDSATAGPEHGQTTQELAHHAAHVMTGRRQAREEAQPREAWDRRVRPSEKDPDERRHGKDFTWHYALALDGAGHPDAADTARHHYPEAQVQVAHERHARGLSRDFPGSGLSPDMPPDLSHLPPMIPAQREGLAAWDSRDYSRRMLDVARDPQPGLRLWRGERRPAADDVPGASSVGMHWSAKPEAVITARDRGDDTRPVVWQARLEHPDSQAIPRSHPVWRGIHQSMDSEAEVRLRPGSSVHVEGAWVGPSGQDSTVHPLHPERNPPGWKWHPVGRHVPVSNRPGEHSMIDYTDAGFPREGLLEHFGAVSTPCQTPGTMYSTDIGEDGDGHLQVSTRTTLPMAVDLDEAGARLLEDQLHNTTELVLAPYFRKDALLEHFATYGEGAQQPVIPASQFPKAHLPRTWRHEDASQEFLNRLMKGVGKDEPMEPVRPVRGHDEERIRDLEPRIRGRNERNMRREMGEHLKGDNPLAEALDKGGAEHSAEEREREHGTGYDTSQASGVPLQPRGYGSEVHLRSSWHMAEAPLMKHIEGGSWPDDATREQFERRRGYGRKRVRRLWERATGKPLACEHESCPPWEHREGHTAGRIGLMAHFGSSDGDRFVTCDQGHDHWGAYGAAGLLVRHKDPRDGRQRYLLQKRSPWVQHGSTWSTPGGAIGQHETPEAGAMREAREELGPLPRDLTHHHTVTDDHGGWKYHTVVMDSPGRFTTRGGDDGETAGSGWFTHEEMQSLRLHPGFAKSWDTVRRSRVDKEAIRHWDDKTAGGVYLRFGHWPEDEHSRNNVTGFREEGVSTYDLDHEGHPKDPDPGAERGHFHDESCAPDCDFDLDNEDYGNDTREEMEGRVRRAERNRYEGRDIKGETAHLVRGDLAGLGHDAEPILRNVRRVGDWIDHRHLFIPGAKPHRLARSPHDEDYEPPEEAPPAHHTAASGYDLSPGSGMISLDIPPGTIEPHPGGVDDHHITVAYLGKGLDDEAYSKACHRAREAAASVPGPFGAVLHGLGTFPPSDSSDGKVPLYMNVHALVPHMSMLRDQLADLSASEHKDWKPHVTLAYLEPGEQLPPERRPAGIRFTHLSVHRGDDTARFPLGG